MTIYLKMFAAMVALFFALLYARDGHCEDPVCYTDATAPPAAQCVAVQRAGQPGAWLGIPWLDTLTKDHLELPHRRAEAVAAVALADVRGQQVALYRAAEADQRVATDAAKAEAINQANARAAAEAALESERTWRWVMVVAGVVAGGLVTGVVVDRLH
jgi:hypothetical protein